MKNTKSICLFLINIFVILSCNVSVSAKERVSIQKGDSIQLVGRVYDKVTSHHVIGTKIELLSHDSLPISKAKGGRYFDSYITTNNGYTYVNDSTSEYKISVPRLSGTYIIKVSKEGFEPLFLPYTLKLSSRDFEKEIPDIFLRRLRVKTLEEFTVKGSKVKFYNKGDTIVYNADAFALPDGSMLDALVSQMPGVEIKKNKIYVNGRFVESLLLNGKDFFKGNKSVMMNNIGAYAVKDIAVYEKKNEMSYVLGDRDDVEKEFVMDVRLKKDYMTGYMVNAEVGGGTDNRYIGRLFCMQYTNNSRLALYGNTNNINKADNLSDGEEEIWIDSNDGINRRINGGLDYRIDDSLHKWEINGNVDAAYNDNRNNKITNSITYLQNISDFNFTNLDSHYHDFSFSTHHTFKVKKKNWNMTLKPKFSYNKNHKNDETVAASFDKEIQDLNSDIIKSIFSGNHQNLVRSLINRNLKVYEGNKHGYNAQFNGETRLKVPGSPDGIAIKVQAKYSRDTQYEKTLQDICFGVDPMSSDKIHRFTSLRPDYNFNLQGLARYYFNIPVGSLNGSYEFAHTQSRKNLETMMLEAMADNDMAEFAPGALPVFDYDNSYKSKLFKNEHRFKFLWRYVKKNSHGRLIIHVEPNLIIENQHLYYQRGDVNADPSRTDFKFSIPETSIEWIANESKQRFYLGYALKQKSVNLVNLVDIRNTTDPLNIFLGNPDLKNSMGHEITGRFHIRSSKNLNQRSSITINWTNNEFVSGYRYDSQTGVKYIKTYNVTGNYNACLSYGLNWDFGYMDRFYINQQISPEIGAYVNMVGYDCEPVKQTVRYLSLNEYFSIGYNIPQKLRISVSETIYLNHSKKPGFMNIKNNSGYSQTRFYVWYKLPFNFAFNTEFIVYKRFGFIEENMNTANLLWNAELSRSFFKDTFRVGIKAYDMLNQMKGVSYSLSATGRTQTLNTVLPRYLMVSLAYRFDFSPKRR